MLPERTDQSIVSVPNSLRHQLERAQNLLSQSENAEANGEHSLAAVRAREGLQLLKTIAQTYPEVATLIYMADRGYHGFDIELTDRSDNYQLVEQKLFGLSMGQEVVNTPTIKRRTIRARIF